METEQGLMKHFKALIVGCLLTVDYDSDYQSYFLRTIRSIYDLIQGCCSQLINFAQLLISY